MPTKDEWRELIQAESDYRPTGLVAETFLERLNSNAQPVRVFASDKNEYLIKGRQKGRVLVNEQVVGKLGSLLGAPVGQAVWVDVPQALVSAEQEMSHMPAGISHGSRWVDGCTDRQGLSYVDVAENQERFAALAVLYSWVGANDHQFIYQKVPPNLVYSVDHGHFFPGGPDWTVDSLSKAGAPVLDSHFQNCDLGSDEFAPFCERLLTMPHSAIACAVARPWSDWQITEGERTELAAYLEGRREGIVRAALGR